MDPRRPSSKSNVDGSLRLTYEVLTLSAFWVTFGNIVTESRDERGKPIDGAVRVTLGDRGIIPATECKYLNSEKLTYHWHIKKGVTISRRYIANIRYRMT